MTSPITRHHPLHHTTLKYKAIHLSLLPTMTPYTLHSLKKTSTISVMLSTTITTVTTTTTTTNNRTTTKDSIDTGFHHYHPSSRDNQTEEETYMPTFNDHHHHPHHSEYANRQYDTSHDVRDDHAPNDNHYDEEYDDHAVEYHDE
mmetsp:Transcript_35064/g.41851  ORF Transcript_35064/g.41851 Transcript_35064/m.41851 type:complete len:145 (-) Transcript_35064:101-535(-)